MKKVAVSNVKNQAILHNIAQMYATLNVMNMDICSGMSASDTTLRYTCTSSQTEIPYQALNQIDFSPPSPGQVQTQPIKITVPSP